VVTSALTLCLSLADFSTPILNKHTIEYYTQRVQDKQKYAINLVSRINVKDNFKSLQNINIDDDVAVFIFEDDKLLQWIHDAPIDEHQLRQIDTVSRFVKINHNWYIVHGFNKENYYIVVTSLLKSDYSFNEQHGKDNIIPVYNITDNITVGPPTRGQSSTIYGINGSPLITLHAEGREQNYNVNIMLRWIAVILLIISLFILYNYFWRYKMVHLFIAAFIALRAILFYAHDFFKADIKLFSPLIYSDSYFFDSLGELLLHTIFSFLIVVLIYKRRKIWERYMSRTTPAKRNLWIAISLIILLASAVFIHHTLRSLVFNSCINLETQHPTELTLYSFIAYLILSISYNTFFIMLYMFIRCSFPKWIGAWRKQTLAFVYIFFISIYTIVSLSIYNAQFDKHRNAVWAYRLVLQDEHETERLLPETKGNANSLPDIFSLPSQYSYAYFVNKKIKSTSGDFKYYHKLVEPWNINSPSEVLIYDEYIHYVYKISDNQTIILSHEMDTLINYAVAFSCLLFFFICLFYIMAYIAGWRLQWVWKNNALRRKIIFSLLGLVVFSSILVCAASLIYNLAQYNTCRRRQMTEQTKSIVFTLNPTLNNLTAEDIKNATDLYPVLVRISKGFKIDVNIYDVHGNLAQSSRPDVFKEHIRSSRMNPEALVNLANGEILHDVIHEKIGQFEFLSAYISYYNQQGELIAYINLPYFINQKKTTDDISAIITTYTNVCILVIIIALIVSMVLSNQITRPLNIVRRNIEGFEESGKLEPIDYDAPDELGELIRSYNEMIRVLEDKNRKLAQAEREGAWRNMARQIAHEIKNPLTPMRLSIQHLMRMKKDNAPDWQEHFEEISNALLEQINILSFTASEFSSYAQTNLKEAVVTDLNIIMHEQKLLFESMPGVQLTTLSKVSPANVKVHHEQIGRVLMNILTNAVQALEENKENGQIIMTLYEHDNRYCISVEDNGHGISEEMSSNLFIPNFTTKRSGSGLGLPICRNIIESHGGSIHYSTSSIGGACFMICLPKITIA
jgi:signal transduction histidine kinase